QGPAQYVQELKSLVNVRPEILRSRLRKLGQIRLELAFARAQIEARQVVTVVGGEPPLRTLLPLLLSRDGDNAPPVFILKEMIERNVEYRRNTKQCGDGRDEFAIFDLRQQSRRKPCALPQLRESHTAAQAKGAKLLADQILRKFRSQRIGDWHVWLPFYLSVT